MIILMVCEENKTAKIKRRKKPKEKLFEYSRSGVIINNKPHYVLTVPETSLEDIEFQNLLSRYKGSVIVPDKLKSFPVFKDVSFDVTPYLKKVLFERVKILLFSGDYRKSSLLVIDSDFALQEELLSLVPFVKNMTVETLDETKSVAFCEKSYVEYGFKPQIINKVEKEKDSFGIILDSDKVKDGFFEVRTAIDTKRFYPDEASFEVPEELKILENLQVGKIMICAAFKDK